MGWVVSSVGVLAENAGGPCNWIGYGCTDVGSSCGLQPWVGKRDRHSRLVLMYPVVRLLQIRLSQLCIQSLFKGTVSCRTPPIALRRGYCLQTVQYLGQRPENQPTLQTTEVDTHPLQSHMCRCNPGARFGFIGVRYVDSAQMLRGGPRPVSWAVTSM